MRNAALGIVVLTGLVIASVYAYPGYGDAGAGYEFPYQAGTRGDQLIAFATTVGETHQQVLVVDPVERAIAVYHVDLATGSVKFCGERSMHFDLQMTHFNSKEPLPSAIEEMLSRQQPR